MSDRTDFVAVDAYVQRSAIVAAIEGIGRAWRIALGQSTTAVRLRRVSARFRSLPLPSRFRAVAVAAVSAAGGYLLVLSILPAQVVPALPRAVWMLVLAAAALGAIWPDPLVGAWDSSWVRRRWRAIVGVDR